jgi:hypothetical protein
MLSQCPFQKQYRLLVETPALFIRELAKPLHDVIGDSFQGQSGHIQQRFFLVAVWL